MRAVCSASKANGYSIIVSMRALSPEATTPHFVPDYTAGSLAEVDFEFLKSRGIRYIAFDADSTLVPFRGRELQEPVRKLLVTKQKLFKGWCIASNRPTRDLEILGRGINAPVIKAGFVARKPRKRYFKRVLGHFNAPATQVAMIGDKLVADMWGAKRVGMTTVWVDKIGQDHPLDRLLKVRAFEKRLMKRFSEANIHVPIHGKVKRG